MNPPATNEGQCHLWFDRGVVVAAAWIHASGYVWCQSWHTPDLANKALEAAQEWGVTPQSPPVLADPFMRHVTWLRTVIPLGWEGAPTGARYDDLDVTDDDRAAEPEALVGRLVASGLEKPGVLQTLTWPALKVSHKDADPDPATAAELTLRLTPEDEPPHDKPGIDTAAEPEVSEQTTEGDSDDLQQRALAAAYAEQRLDEDEFVSAVRDGASQAHLGVWLAALLAALEDLADPSAGDGWALGDLLRRSVQLRRGDVNPLAGYLEAPDSIIELNQRHGRALHDLVAERDRVFDELLGDAAAEYHRTLPEPVRWADLIEHGASPKRPEPPDEED